MAASTPDEDQLSDASSPLESPSSPDLPSPSSPSGQPPVGRSVSTAPITSGMTASSTPLGTLNAARRPAPKAPTLSSRGSGPSLPQDIMNRVNALHLARRGAPPPNPMRQTPGAPAPTAARNPMPQSPGGAFVGGVPKNFPLPGQPGKPAIGHFPSAPAVPSLHGPSGVKKPSLAEKRGLALPGGLPGSQPNGTPGPAPGGRKKPGLKLSDINGPPGGDAGGQNAGAQPNGGSMMDKYAEFLDKETGSLRFAGKAVLTSTGVDFESGSSFRISLDEVDTLDELGKGNYGTVYKVRHARPQMRRPGLGLAGNKAHSMPVVPGSPANKTDGAADSSPTSAKATGGTTNVVMAMKEIRLELDDAKFAAIIMELDILHRCVSPYIIDFYGAFFQEGAVYICMEFMDGGSIDKLYGDGIPENVLRKITLATTMGLKSLKDDHNIIHRDVKPTNILINTKGQVKICDFGVSGNLVASIAKTNIGCQSYMAPERISNGGIAQAGANPGGGTYSVQSDIWSLGLTIIECAMGRYPYPPETYNNIFSQLSAIVDGEPPDLPADGFSEAARNFVRGCLNKIPNLRPTYAMLLQHAWLAPLLKPATISEEEEESEDASSASSLTVDYTGPEAPEDPEVAQWVLDALEKKRTGKLAQSLKPALHAAPLDAVSSPQGTPSATPDAPPPPPAEEE